MSSSKDAALTLTLRALRVRPVLAAKLVFVFLSGCQALIGIEEGVYTAPATSEEEPRDAGNTMDAGAPPPTAECVSYCDEVMNSCSGEQQNYSSVDTCLAICAALPLGDALEPAGNTVACRAQEARSARGTGEPSEHCPNAAPGGGERCGSPCESYCNLLPQICPDVPIPAGDCEQKCGAIRDDVPFQASVLEGDNLTCRLVHLSAAAVNPELHCDHIGVLPTGYCVDPPDEAPTCADYCRAVTTACTDETAVYDGAADCLLACEVFSKGTNAEPNGNTLACRRYHAFAALLVPAVHCPHAGPTGGGACVDDREDLPGANCLAYCALAEAACSDEFGTQFGAENDCQAACLDLAGADVASYGVSPEEPSEFQCRIAAAVRAFGDSAACAAAVGAVECTAAP